MVTVTGYRLAKSKDDKEFIALELMGDVEMIQSLLTGYFYATARKASITSTFNEATAQGLIGSKLSGKIIKVESEPYDYTVAETGEVIKLAHKYQYQPEVVPYSPIPERQFSLKRSFVNV